MPAGQGTSTISDVFISYSRDDRAVAQRYAAAFEAQGFSVWWDAALRPGEAFDEVIEAALRDAKAVVVLWSPRSVGSRWVRAEATMADRAKTLAPVIIEPCTRPIMFELTQTADLCHWQGDDGDPVWRNLVGDVRDLVGVRQAPEPAAASPASSAPEVEDSRPVVVVLPFANMSGDGEQEFFSDGVTDDIITDLCRVSALSVVSRNRAFTFKGKAIAADQLVATLGVTHIVEGSVRKSGDRVRITVQLMDASKDTQIWAERFDRTLDDIFAIQDEISRAIVGALQVQLAPAEQKAIAQRPTVNAEAYELYMLARLFTRGGSERMKPMIVRICRRAVDLDPNFGMAWALMAFAQADIVQRMEQGIDLGREAAARAIAVAPNLAETHAAMAEIMWGDPEAELHAADRHAETALKLDPECFEAQYVAGNLALRQGRFAEAILHLEEASRIEPLSFRASGMVTQAYAAVGDKDNETAANRRTIARCEQVLAMEPDHCGALGFLIAALAGMGETDRARQWARRATLIDPDEPRMNYNIACAMAALGDVDLACEILEGLIPKMNTRWVGWLLVDNDYDPIREHPRFQALIADAKARVAAKDVKAAE